MKWGRSSNSPESIREIFVHSPRETVDSDDVLIRCSDNAYQMSLGIHLSPKPIDINSATWPKMKRSDSNSGDVDVSKIIRPQTATLERPRILDVTLIGKIDMSLTRKGLLSISNLCVAPLENIQKRNAITNRENRHGGKTRKWHTNRRSMDDKDRIKQIKNQCKRNGEKIYESWEEDENSVSDSTLSVKKVSKPIVGLKSPRGTPVKQLLPRDKRVSPINSVNSNTNSPARRTLQPPKDKRLSPVSSGPSSPSRTGKKAPSEKRTSSDNSNRNSSSNSNTSDENTEKPNRKTCKRPVIVKKDGKNVDEVFGGPKPGVVPEPCRTCGRPEQPERFHSHPPPSSHKQTSAMKRQQDNNNNNDDSARSTVVVKSSVRKPVPIKYRSGKSNRRKSTTPETSVPSKVPSPDPLRRNSKVGLETQPMERKSPRSGVFVVLDEKPVVKAGPRTVLCYLCGREFGTASFPLHEPHCLQKWERENAKLPSHLKRSVPEKPSSPLTVEQWNAFAWEASQAHLVPCENCGRTFNPDRVEVHQRSCKPVGQPRRSNLQEQDSETSAVKVPPAVYCYICGKMFGTRSIAIHEPQCLEKWRHENENLPANQRRPEPIKPQTRVTSTSIATSKARQAPSHAAEPEKDPSLVAAPHTMDCYLCGREFDTRVLNKHEEECLKEWRKWNKSLPPDQRRPEPERPEFKFNKATGNIDFKATMDAIWHEHLKSLVPCSKGCGRTFNPDRVEIHERGCKGPTATTTKK